MGIQQRLAKFPVPAQVWDEYHMDQEINDRGVRLDMDLVTAAIEMDTRSRTQLVDTMKKITQLENPNSVQQMKAWLSDNGLQTDTLSQLIRTAFIPREGAQFLMADFSAIEARVIAWFAGEKWRQDVFAKGGDIYCASASQMFKVPVEKHGINGHLRQKGKIAELTLGYGGSVEALKAMGALDMGLTEEELHPLVDAWRQSNPNIIKFWWDVDHAVMEAVKFKHTTSEYGLTFSYRSGMLFITLPSGRKLAYVKPKNSSSVLENDSILEKLPLTAGELSRWYKTLKEWALLLFLSARNLRICPHQQKSL